MNARTPLSVLAALAVSTLAYAECDPLPVNGRDLGTFRNQGVGVVAYAGAFADHFSVTIVNDTANRVDIDLGAIMATLGEIELVGIRVIDPGKNQYTESNVNSSGADIDLFIFSGLPEKTDVCYAYDGPTPAHIDEATELLATRLATINADTTHEWETLNHVSLGRDGVVMAKLTAPGGGGPIITPPPPGGPIPEPNPGGKNGGKGPILHVREAGGHLESFRVELVVAQSTACHADVNGDGTVNIADLIEVIIEWGPCP